MAMVTCGGCGLKFDRSGQEAEFIKGKWYHEGCAQIKKEKIELDNYICELFDLKRPGPMNNVLIKKYHEEKGYNYVGMLNALKYFYRIKKHSTDKSEERVGIIPFIYAEAEEYFNNLERIERKRLNKIIPETKREEISITMCNPQLDKQKSKTEDLDSLFEE